MDHAARSGRGPRQLRGRGLMVVAAGLTAAVSFGCDAAGTAGGGSATGHQSSPPGAPQAAGPSASAGGSVQPASCAAGVPAVKLSTDRQSYPTPGLVTITLTVTNPGPPCIAGLVDCANQARVYAASTEVWDSRAPITSPTCPGPTSGPTVPSGTTTAATWTWDQCASASILPGPCIGPPPPALYTAVGEWGRMEDSPPAPFRLTSPPCTATDVAVAARTDRSTYTPGSPVHIEVTVTSRVDHLCLVRAGPVLIRRGSVAVYHKEPCGDGIACGPFEATAGLLPRHGSLSYSLDWDQADCSGGGCPGPRAAPGVYTLDAGDGAAVSITLR